jgi:hypothetical protein
VIKQRHLGITAVRPGDAEVAAEDGANAMRDIELDHTTLPQLSTQEQFGVRLWTIQ